jgi:hypothetical protein
MYDKGFVSTYLQVTTGQDRVLTAIAAVKCHRIMGTIRETL